MFVTSVKHQKLQFFVSSINEVIDNDQRKNNIHEKIAIVQLTIDSRLRAVTSSFEEVVKNYYYFFGRCCCIVWLLLALNYFHRFAS